VVRRRALARSLLDIGSGNWLFEGGIISSNDLTLECPFINVGPFFFHHCRPHIPSIDV